MNERFKQIIPALIPGGVGVVVILMGSGVIPLDPESLNAPRWVMIFFGIPFLSVGIWILSTQVPALSWFENYVGLIIFTSFALLCDWIAFGPGERQFETNVPSLAGSIIGRIAFAIPGVLLSCFIGTCWYRVLTRRKKDSHQ